jgi:hypothetical protein
MDANFFKGAYFRGTPKTGYLKTFPQKAVNFHLHHSSPTSP